MAGLFLPFLIAILQPVSGWSAPDELKITIAPAEPKSGTGIQGLQISREPIQPEPGQQNYQIIAKIQVKGTYLREDWHLLVNNNEVTTGKDGTFRVALAFAGPATQLLFSAVGPRGQIEKQSFALSFPGFAFWAADLKDPLKKRHSFSATLGATLLGYEETDSDPLNQIAMTGKMAYTYLLFPPRWDFGASAYMNLATVSTNQPGKTARFLGLNARIGYVVPGVQEPWRLSLMSGVYWVSMFVTGNEFGFNNLMGPQVFPVLRKMMPSGDSIVGYGKFSPVGSGLSFLNLGNREIAFGASYIHRLSGFHALSVGLDFSDLRLSIPNEDQSAIVDIASRSISLGVGYAW